MMDDLHAEWISAEEIARQHGLPARSFMSSLRRAKLPWHVQNDRWEAPVGSPEHEDMLQVAVRMRPPAGTAAPADQWRRRNGRAPVSPAAGGRSNR